jgi:hypothetical protein
MVDGDDARVIMYNDTNAAEAMHFFNTLENMRKEKLFIPITMSGAYIDEVPDEICNFVLEIEEVVIELDGLNTNKITYKVVAKGILLELRVWDIVH